MNALEGILRDTCGAMVRDGDRLVDCCKAKPTTRVRAKLKGMLIDLKVCEKHAQKIIIEGRKS